MFDDPLPVRLKATGHDTMDVFGMESVSYQLDGMLHLADDCVTLEWTGTRTVEKFGFQRVGTDVEDLPLEWLEMPMDRIAGAWVLGGWWRPRLELRSRALVDFDGVPGARGITLTLWLHRRDRALARHVAEEITAAAAAAAQRADDRLLPSDGEDTR